MFKNALSWIVVIALTVVLWAACSSGGGGGNNGDSGGDGGDGDPGGGDTSANLAPYPQMTWQISNVDVGDPTKPSGLQGKLIRGADGTLYYAYLKFVEGEPDCDIAVFSDGGFAPSVQYEVRLATRPAGSTAWGVETVPLDQVGAPNNVPYMTSRWGIDAVFDRNGRLTLAFAAGGSGLFSCGSSDLVVATKLAGGSWQFSTPATSSADCCPANECPDPACTSGTDVGPWSAIARDPNGDLAVAYIDQHNATDEDGTSFIGLEFWHQTGGISGIKPWSGLGEFNTMAYSGSTAIVVTTGFQRPGLFVYRRTGSAGSVNDWQERVLRQAPSVVGESISLAVGQNGRVGLAFNELVDAFGATVNDLIYCESADHGETWAACENVDFPILNLGRHPDLVFDSAGRPVISYRVCGNGSSCDAATDGLRIAWRELNGTWGTADVLFDGTTKSGAFSQIVLDPVTDEPTIVFHDETRGGALVAVGSLQ